MVGNLGNDDLRGGNGDDVLIGDAFGAPEAVDPVDTCDGGRGFDLAAGCDTETAIEGAATEE